METPDPAGRRPATHELRTALFRDATEIARAEFARPLTLAEVAGRVATSPRQLRRAFEEVGGTTFRAFLGELRMAHAAELLRATELPVREVARRVGYREPSRFTKAFKRRYGVTPTRFRATADPLTRNPGLKRPTCPGSASRAACPPFSRRYRGNS